MTPAFHQALHQFLTLLLIYTLLPNLTFYLIARGFHRTFATGAACQQRTLTPLDTWSCLTLRLASVLMLRPISPELVLLLDFWVSNIPRYFCFCFITNIKSFNYSTLYTTIPHQKLQASKYCKELLHSQKWNSEIQIFGNMTIGTLFC